jgi:hypothetical protein
MKWNQAALLAAGVSLLYGCSSTGPPLTPEQEAARMQATAAMMGAMAANRPPPFYTPPQLGGPMPTPAYVPPPAQPVSIPPPQPLYTPPPLTPPPPKQVVRCSNTALGVSCY